MKSKVIKLLLWALRKLGYSIPVVKPTLIQIRDCERAIVNERMSWYQVEEWTKCSRINLNAEVEWRVRDEMGRQIANKLKVFKYRTPDDSIEWRCDVIFKDMEPFEREQERFFDNFFDRLP